MEDCKFSLRGELASYNLHSEDALTVGELVL